MNKVLTTTEFVLWLKQNDHPTSYEDDMWKVIRYAELMQQPLTLSMFVPCVDGKPIEQPKESDYTQHSAETNLRFYESNKMKYEQAKEQVLFEGFFVEKSKVGRRGTITRRLTDGLNSTITATDWIEKDDWTFHDKETLEDLVNYYRRDEIFNNIGLTPTEVLKKKVGL